MRKGGSKKSGKSHGARGGRAYMERLEAQRAKVANDEAIEMQYAVDQVAEHSRAAQQRRKVRRGAAICTVSPELEGCEY